MNAAMAGMDGASLLWGLVFGSIGFAYFMYGKKQSALVPALTGVMLMVYPYFVSNTVALVLIGAVLMAVPYFVRL